jgi:eukaryotic-like serine/threonine-protein kinase
VVTPPARRFGPYEIIRRLGKSMNDVYLARDTREDRQTALKLIKCGPDAVSRLILEAERRGADLQQRLRALDSRVIEIYDYGDLDGYFYVAMQYVEGRNLSEVLRGDGRLSALRAARIAMEICGQLAKFHGFQDGSATAVVHGDIKPSNVLLGPNDTVRLLDFGIAKALRPDHDFTFHNFGSPSYCSPERLGRSQVDPQADLWAVGATLYEMVAGAPPYQAEDTRKLERLIQSGRPPRALPAGCPRPLKAVISKALAPDPPRRYASASAFHDDLQAFLEGRETAAEQERRWSWRPNPTQESARGGERRRISRPRRGWHIALQIAGAAACILLGMAVFMGTSYFARFTTASRRLRANLDYTRRPVAELNADWSFYRGLERQFAFLGSRSPVDQLRAPLRKAYEGAGVEVLQAYDRSSDPALRDFDWAKAELCFARANELGATGPQALARLDVARGYATLRRIMDWTGNHPAQLVSMRQSARDSFAAAARFLPQWPDPHLGLARVYLYSLPAMDRALAELGAAQSLGYAPGARETEQRADAYRLRGFEEWRGGNLPAARQDFSMARTLYEGIPGFSRADYHLRQIPDLTPPPPRRRRHARHQPRYRRWR